MAWWNTRSQSVEAFRLPEMPGASYVAPTWWNNALKHGAGPKPELFPAVRFKGTHWVIMNAKGKVLNAQPGDWVIQYTWKTGVFPGLRVMPHEVFNEIYEPAASEARAIEGPS
jgi:hypothetical protein